MYTCIIIYYSLYSVHGTFRWMRNEDSEVTKRRPLSYLFYLVFFICKDLCLFQPTFSYFLLDTFSFASSSTQRRRRRRRLNDSKTFTSPYSRFCMYPCTILYALHSASLLSLLFGGLFFLHSLLDFANFNLINLHLIFFFFPSLPS